MITRFVLIIILLCFHCELFSQKNISRDADGYIWIISDTIDNQLLYMDKYGNLTEVFPMKSQKSDLEILDSLIMCYQYDLWSKTKDCNSFEPYAAAVYSILFSNAMKIKEIRILRREAYTNNSIIDNILIKSIKKSGERVWKKKRSTKEKKNSVFVSRTKVIIPMQSRGRF